jgi:hypothetical protein
MDCIELFPRYINAKTCIEARQYRDRICGFTDRGHWTQRRTAHITFQNCQRWMQDKDCFNK